MDEKKKVNLAEAMKQRLAEKKAQQNGNKQDKKFVSKNQTMKSQLHKKASSTRRKMGS